jgi:hypothetical protein
MKHVWITIVLITGLCVTHGIAAESTVIPTPCVESFPREGKGYTLIDWQQRAQDFLAFTLDPVRGKNPLRAWKALCGECHCRLRSSTACSIHFKMKGHL